MNDDIRLAVRGFFKSPLFSLIAIASLALGIGANAAIFSLLDQVLLRSLPVKNPEELIQISQKGSHYGSNRGSRMNSYPLYRDYRDRSEALNGVICRREIDTSIAFGGSTERVQGELISGNYFQVLGVAPAAGRLFTQEDDKLPGGHPLAVLSYDYWQTRFNADPKIIGQSVKVNNFPLTVIGVSGRGFHGLDPAGSPAIRIPVAMKKQMTPGWDDTEDRRSRWVQVFARLKPGISEPQAKAALQTQFHAIREEEVKASAFKNATDYDKRQFLKGLVVVVRAANGYSDLRQSFTEPLQILMGIVAMVLLIACSNVANLMIARATGRRKELAVRAALGASRWRLMRPLIIESLLLSLTGGLAGLALAYALDALLISFLPTGGSPLMISSSPDWRVFSFTLGVAILTGLVFGLFPAVTAARTDASPALKAEGRGMSSGGASLMRKTLVGVQVALSVMLLIAAGLFVQSLQNLRHVDTGLTVSRLATFSINPALNGYTVERIKVLQQQLLERLRAMPGVESAAIGNIAKMSGDEWDSSMSVQGYQAKPGEDINPFMDAVTPSYAETLGMKIVEGRDFRDSDTAKDAVCMINKKFADKYFHGKSPIGMHMGFGSDPGTKMPMEIVGVYSNAKYMNVRDEIQIQAFIPIYSSTYPGTFVTFVRTKGGEAGVFNEARAIVKNLDPSLAIFNQISLEDQVDQILSTERLVSFLATAFGVIATLLAAIGLYGVLALAVSRRTKEIGIRLALGAEASNVITLVIKEIVLLILGGIVVGVPAAILLSRFIEKQLYGLKATDPLVFAVAVLLIASVALFAAYLPARRATKVNPLDVLRYE